MVYTSYLWRSWGWFMIVLSTLSVYFGIRIGLLGPVQPATSLCCSPNPLITLQDGFVTKTFRCVFCLVMEAWTGGKPEFPRLSPSIWLTCPGHPLFHQYNPCISAAAVLCPPKIHFNATRPDSRPDVNESDELMEGGNRPEESRNLPDTSSWSGWWYTYPSEKYEFVSWDDDIPNIWKFIKACSKPPTSNVLPEVHFSQVVPRICCS